MAAMVRPPSAIAPTEAMPLTLRPSARTMTERPPMTFIARRGRSARSGRRILRLCAAPLRESCPLFPLPLLPEPGIEPPLFPLPLSFTLLLLLSD